MLLSERNKLILGEIVHYFLISCNYFDLNLGIECNEYVPLCKNYS